MSGGSSVVPFAYMWHLTTSSFGTKTRILYYLWVTLLEHESDYWFFIFRLESVDFYLTTLLWFVVSQHVNKVAFRKAQLSYASRESLKSRKVVFSLHRMCGCKWNLRMKFINPLTNCTMVIWYRAFLNRGTARRRADNVVDARLPMMHYPLAAAAAAHRCAVLSSAQVRVKGSLFILLFIWLFVYGLRSSK